MSATQHDHLLQLINDVKLPAMVDLLLQKPPNSIIHWIQIWAVGVLGSHFWLNEGNILLTQVYDSVSSCSVRWRSIHMWRPVACYAFIKITLPLVTLCSLYVPKHAFDCYKQQVVKVI